MQESDIFSTVKAAPIDPTFGFNEMYAKDPNPNKINLCLGAYMDDEGKHYDFKILSKVAQEILTDQKLNKAYLPFGGDPQYCRLSQLFLFGGLEQGSLSEEQFKSQREQKSYKDIATVQTLSGTGALRLGVEFLTRVLFRDEGQGQTDRPPLSYKGVILVPKQSWPNHRPIFESAGLLIQEYPYYDTSNTTHQILVDGLLSKLNEAKPNTVVLFQTCGNNPTAVDPTMEQWTKIAKVAQERKLMILFDCTYVGFASGDLDADLAALRLFRDMKIPMVVAQSYAKNMSLYGERVGALHVVTYNEDSATKVASQIKHLIRRLYSNPPKYGSEQAKRLLRDHYTEWKAELKSVFENILSRRTALYEALKKEEITVKGEPLNWDFIVKRQCGWFVNTEMSPEECGKLQSDHSIYIQKTGRVTLTHLNPSNIPYLASSMKKVIEAVHGK